MPFLLYKESFSTAVSKEQTDNGMVSSAYANRHTQTHISVYIPIYLSQANTCFLETSILTIVA